MKNQVLIKVLEFLSYHLETWSKWRSNGVVLWTKSHDDSSKILDSLLVVNLWSCLAFFESVSSIVDFNPKLNRWKHDNMFMNHNASKLITLQNWSDPLLLLTWNNTAPLFYPSFLDLEGQIYCILNLTRLEKAPFFMHTIPWNSVKFVL